MRIQTGITLLALSTLGVCATLSSASAGESSTVSVQCAATDALPPIGGNVYTTCFGDAQFKFHSDGVPTAYGLKITASPMHCSAVNYQVYATYDPNLLLGKTQNFLEAGQSEIVPIGNNFARGLQVVNIRALGKVGGCNTGRMQGWSGRVDVVIIP